MRAENGVFPSDWALGDFYAILSVKISAFESHYAPHGAKRMGVKTPVLTDKREYFKAKHKKNNQRLCKAV